MQGQEVISGGVLFLEDEIGEGWSIGRNCFLQCQMNELQELMAQPAAWCLPVSQQ